MNDESQQVLDELQQLINQYRQEVPGGRHAWPESIKSRVVKLNALGVNLNEVAERCSISYFTIRNWIPEPERRRRLRKNRTEHTQAPAHFAPVAIRKSRSIATVTMTADRQLPIPKPIQVATVTVTLPGGIRLEGVTPEFLSSWLKKKGTLPS